MGVLRTGIFCGGSWAISCPRVSVSMWPGGVTAWPLSTREPLCFLTRGLDNSPECPQLGCGFLSADRHLNLNQSGADI